MANNSNPEIVDIHQLSIHAANVLEGARKAEKALEITWMGKRLGFFVPTNSDEPVDQTALNALNEVLNRLAPDEAQSDGGTFVWIR